MEVIWSDIPAQALCLVKYLDSLEDLQGWRIQQLSRQSLPALYHPYSKEVSPDVQDIPSVFRTVPTASGPVT